MKDYLNMMPGELAEQTRALDAGAIPPGRPMAPALRARWDNARAGGAASLPVGPGRSKLGEGAVPVPVSVEAGLLRRAAAKAEALKLKRSEYFAKALQLLTDGEAEVAGRRMTVVTDTPTGAPARIRTAEPKTRRKSAG